MTETSVLARCSQQCVSKDKQPRANLLSALKAPQVAGIKAHMAHFSTTFCSEALVVGSNLPDDGLAGKICIYTIEEED